MQHQNMQQGVGGGVPTAGSVGAVGAAVAGGAPHKQGKAAIAHGPCYMKLLVDNFVAGSIIGQRGSVIAMMERDCGVIMKLSPTNVYFPGTQDRIVVMGGRMDALHRALREILKKVQESAAINGPALPHEGRGPRPILCQMVVPETTISAVIGRGGEKLKALQARTQAKVHVANKGPALGGPSAVALSERIISVNGPQDAVYEAIAHIAESIQGDPSLKEYLDVNYEGLAGARGPYGDDSRPTSLPHNISYEIYQQSCEIDMKIPDLLVGAVIGKGGSSLQDITNTSGAKIQISQKGDYYEGTRDRKVTLQGSVTSVHTAHVLLLQRITEAESANLRSPHSSVDPSLVPPNTDVPSQTTTVRLPTYPQTPPPPAISAPQQAPSSESASVLPSAQPQGGFSFAQYARARPFPAYNATNAFYPAHIGWDAYTMGQLGPAGQTTQMQQQRQQGQQQQSQQQQGLGRY